MARRGSGWALLVGAMVCVVPAAAGDAPPPPLGNAIEWRSIGPGGGGWIESLAWHPQDPDTLLLGCDVGGFYLSADGGLNWAIHNEGLRDYFVESIAVSPADPMTLLLGTESGVFRSGDGGLTWEWQREGFPPAERYSFSAPVSVVCFDPADPRVAYAGIGRPRWGSGGAGTVYRSEDEGRTWSIPHARDALPPEAVVSDLEATADGRTLLLATDHGLFRSEDRGATWDPSGDGLPHSDVEEVAAAPSNAAVVYCTLRTKARDDEPFDGGVYRSDDGGRTWRQASAGLPMRVGAADEPEPMTSSYQQIVVDPRDPDIAYVGDAAWVTAGVSKTVDGGQTWRQVTLHGSEPRNMDYGWITQWGPSVTCLEVHPRQPDRLAFGTSGHVFVTADGGATWEQRYCRMEGDGTFRGTGLEVTCLFDIVPDPYSPGRVFFGYYDVGLLVSEDGGTLFQRHHQGMEHEGNCFTVVVDPADRAKLWACTGEWATNAGRICRSGDGGRTWRVVGRAETGLPDGATRTLILDPSSPPGRRTLHVTVEGFGVYRSDDDGDSWISISSGLPEGARGHPAGLILNPANPRHLRVALSGPPSSGAGLFETRDGGGSWQRVSGDTPFADVQRLLADPTDWETLYLCRREHYDRTVEPAQLYPGGLFRSADGGRTWTQILDYHFVSSVAVSPLDGHVLYAATTDHPYHDDNASWGLLRSPDGGATWTRELAGLTSTHVTCVRVDPLEPRRLYVGTGGNGAFVGMDREIGGED